MAFPSESAPPTLLEWAGGEDAIARMIDRFYDRVERDAELSGYFPGGVSVEHRLHVSWWWCEVFGGSAVYTERLGGYRRMVDHHRELAITNEHRLRFSTTMSMAAADAGLPADPEFRSALVAYLEWGTRLATHNSQPGADLSADAPVPRWGWGEAPPFEGSARSPSNACAIVLAERARSRTGAAISPRSGGAASGRCRPDR